VGNLPPAQEATFFIARRKILVRPLLMLENWARPGKRPWLIGTSNLQELVRLFSFQPTRRALMLASNPRLVHLEPPQSALAQDCELLVRASPWLDDPVGFPPHVSGACDAAKIDLVGAQWQLNRGGVEWGFLRSDYNVFRLRPGP